MPALKYLDSFTNGPGFLVLLTVPAASVNMCLDLNFVFQELEEVPEEMDAREMGRKKFAPLSVHRIF